MQRQTASLVTEIQFVKVRFLNADSREMQNVIYEWSLGDVTLAVDTLTWPSFPRRHLEVLASRYCIKPLKQKEYNILVVARITMNNGGGKERAVGC